jgi:[acyl-carrier-protein] S-malonyltransferase
MDLVLLFPGQGSQQPGMGRDLADNFPAAKAVFDTADRTLGESLSDICFNGPAEALRETHVAQPALLAHGAAVWAAIRDAAAKHVRAAAGHSLGEFTAFHATGSLSLESALRLVRTRGELMHRTGIERPGAMAAILGTMSASIEETCALASAETGTVVPANFNADEQVVVSGEVAAVERVMELAKEAGAKRAVRLNVSGAFHSPLMESAVPGLQAAIDLAAPDDPSVPVYCNVTAAPCTTGAEARSLLLRQLTSPVRWATQVRKMAADYPGATFVEMGPGAVLTGLMKRLAPEARAITCGTAAEVESLLQQVRNAD